MSFSMTFIKGAQSDYKLVKSTNINLTNKIQYNHMM